MKIAIASVQSPFVTGGAEYHANGLLKALKSYGFDADLVTAPFNFGPANKVRQSIRYWEKQNFSRFDSNKIDLVICLKFPTYFLQHDNKVLWLLHQHRSVYDLWDLDKNKGHKFTWYEKILKTEIKRKDNFYIEKIKKRFTNSVNVSRRLLEYNKIDSSPLYHPPYLKPSPGSFENYIFCPSRVEPLKRQSLLLDALRFSKSSIKIVFSGTGSQLSILKKRANHLGVDHRVTWLGETPNDSMLHHYKNCMAVFFGPFDEDYGYVTLEAMQAAKPVITCTDSGGPLEFVDHNETGFIVSPCAQEIAEVIDRLSSNSNLAKKFGCSALEKYNSMNFSWSRVVETLVY